MKPFFKFILFCLVCFVPTKIYAASPVISINEIAWMGTETSANNEWIELKNNSYQEIAIDNWTLSAQDGSPKIILKGKIAANGYFLLKRTNDETIPTIIADQIYTGALGNDGENLILKDSSENIIDQINAPSGWPSGDKTTKQTMERSSNGSWQTSQNAGGTPKAANGSPVVSPPPTSHPPSISPLPTTPAVSSSTNSTTTIQSSSPNYQFSKEIFINEFLPNPENDQKEWVEIFNTGKEKVNLDGWQIKDSSSSKGLSIPEKEIKPDELLIIVLEKNILNNDGDEVELLWPDGQIIHSINYADAPRNMSCAKISNKWLWTNQPTPGEENKKSQTGISVIKEFAAPLANAKTEAASAYENPPSKIQKISSAPTQTLETNIEPQQTSLSQAPKIIAAAGQTIPPKISGFKNSLIFLLVIFSSLFAAIAFIRFRRKIDKNKKGF